MYLFCPNKVPTEKFENKNEEKITFVHTDECLSMFESHRQYCTVSFFDEGIFTSFWNTSHINNRREFLNYFLQYYTYSILSSIKHIIIDRSTHASYSKMGNFHKLSTIPDNHDGNSGKANTRNILFGSITIVIIIFMCFIAACLNSRRRRRVAREIGEEAINARENEERDIEQRRKQVERDILSIVSFIQYSIHLVLLFVVYLFQIFPPQIKNK